MKLVGEHDLVALPNEQTRLGRSRFLRLTGVALFTTAAGMLTAGKAEAAPNTCSGSAPYPCYGAAECKWTSDCCVGCKAATTCSGKQCWKTCAPNGRLYDCCDWNSSCGLCICSKCHNCYPGC